MYIRSAPKRCTATVVFTFRYYYLPGYTITRTRICWRKTKHCWIKCTFFFFFFFSSNSLSSHIFFSLSFPLVTPIRGHIAGSSPPFPLRYYVATYLVCTKHCSGQCNAMSSYYDTTGTTYTIYEVGKRKETIKEKTIT